MFSLRDSDIDKLFRSLHQDNNISRYQPLGFVDLTSGSARDENRKVEVNLSGLTLKTRRMTYKTSFDLCKSFPIDSRQSVDMQR